MSGTLLLFLECFQFFTDSIRTFSVEFSLEATPAPSIAMLSYLWNCCFTFNIHSSFSAKPFSPRCSGSVYEYRVNCWHLISPRFQSKSKGYIGNIFQSYTHTTKSISFYLSSPGLHKQVFLRRRNFEYKISCFQYVSTFCGFCLGCGA